MGGRGEESERFAGSEGNGARKKVPDTVWRQATDGWFILAAVAQFVLLED